MELFEKTAFAPDFSKCILDLLKNVIEGKILLQDNARYILQNIYELLENNNLNKKEAIFRLIDELPELFIKINNAISLDIMNICGLIRNQNLEEDKNKDTDTDFISLLGFNSDLDNMNTYNKFLEKSIRLIRSINRSIVDDGYDQSKKERIFYKIMSSELFKDTEINDEIQIVHFISFTNDKINKKEYSKNSNSDNMFVKVIVPKECFNACIYREPSEKTSIWSKIGGLFTDKKEERREILITPPFTIFKVLAKKDKYIKLKIEKDNKDYYDSKEQSSKSKNKNENESESDFESESNRDFESESESDLESESKSDSESEPKSELESDSESDLESESISEENHNSISTYSREFRIGVLYTLN